jgi:hypothetical protein
MSRAHIIKRDAAKREARKTKEERKFANKKWNTPTQIPAEHLWFTFGDQYYKMDYWVRLGTPGDWTYVRGYPNGGYMNSTDGSGRIWSPEDKIQIALCLGADQNCPIDRRLLLLTEASAALQLMEDLGVEADQALAIVRALRSTQEERQKAHEEYRRQRGAAVVPPDGGGSKAPADHRAPAGRPDGSEDPDGQAWWTKR